MMGFLHLLGLVLLLVGAGAGYGVQEEPVDSNPGTGTGTPERVVFPDESDSGELTLSIGS